MLQKKFVDQDTQFIERWGKIGDFFMEWSVPVLTIRLVRTIKTILKKNSNAVIAVSPSSFSNPYKPRAEEICVAACKRTGVAVLLLPTRFHTLNIKKKWKRSRHRLYKPTLKDVYFYYKLTIARLQANADLVVYGGSSAHKTALKIKIALERAGYLKK